MFDIDMIKKDATSFYPFMVEHFARTLSDIEDEEDTLSGNVTELAGFLSYKFEIFEASVAKDESDSDSAMEALNAIISHCDNHKDEGLLSVCRDAKHVMRIINLLPKVCFNVEARLRQAYEAKFDENT